MNQGWQRTRDGNLGVLFRVSKTIIPTAVISVVLISIKAETRPPLLRSALAPRLCGFKTRLLVSSQLAAGQDLPARDGVTLALTKARWTYPHGHSTDGVRGLDGLLPYGGVCGREVGHQADAAGVPFGETLFQDPDWGKLASCVMTLPQGTRPGQRYAMGGECV